MNPELRALIKRYVIMSLVLAAGGVIAATWAQHDRDKRLAAEQAAP